MKKYQLKYNNGTELLRLTESDRLYDILVYTNRFVGIEELKKLSIWMDGKVLE